MFNAAGLMVPEPSIMFPPRPFIDVVTTGCDAEYMATQAVRPWLKLRGQAIVAPPVVVVVRESARRKQELDTVVRAVLSVEWGREASDGQRREAFACRRVPR